MSGSRPEPEAVTASAGTEFASTVWPGTLSNAAIAARRSVMVLTRSALDGPRLEAPDDVGSQPALPAAEGRDWNHSGRGSPLASTKPWPISDEPITRPEASVTMEPSALECRPGSRAMPVTASGYPTPSSTVNATII